MPQSIELFKIALFPAGAQFSKIDMQQRIEETLDDVTAMLPELGQLNAFEVETELKQEREHLMLVVLLCDSRQLQLPALAQNESAYEVRLRFMRRIRELPALMTLLVLDAEAEPNSDELPLKQLIRRKQNTQMSLWVSGEPVTLTFPEMRRDVLDPIPREISFRIEALKRVYAQIKSVDDPKVASMLPSRAFRLSIRTMTRDPDFRKAMSDALFENKRVHCRVLAYLDAISYQVQDYDLIEMKLLGDA